MRNLENFSVSKKIVLFRADLNVPVVNGNITDISRIELIKPSIKKLLTKQNKIFIFSHFGRPQGKENKNYSLSFIIKTLENEFELEKIHFLENLNENSIKNKIREMNLGEICLVENIRFYSEEEKNDINFAKQVCRYFEVYVNDAFSSSHRNHSSIVGFTKFLPSIAGDGLLKEIKNLELFLKKPKKPNLAIIGGSKISTKIDLLNNLIESVNTIAIGGAMANTFLYANDIKIGKSLAEIELFDKAKKISTKANNYNCKLILPIDVICAKNTNDKNNIHYCDINNIMPDHMILDIGKKTTNLIIKEIIKSRMVLWNGPLGAFEHKPFDQSSIEIANAIKKYSNDLNITSLAGGGDTISAIKSTRSEDGFSYISKAGGAFLEWLEGNGSPGVNALKENKL